MPPATKKDVALVIFDLKSSNKDQLLEGLIKMVTYRMLCSKDLFNLILVNSSQTDNSKNVRNVVKRGNAEIDPKAIFQCINDEEVSEDDPVDFLDALMLGIYYMKPAGELPGVVNKQIIYFTNLENQKFEEDNKNILNIIKDLNTNEIYLYIVGPDVQMPFTIAKPDDVPVCMEKIMLDESNAALVAARRIVQQTKRSVLCNLKIGLHLVNFLRNSYGSQPWLVPITIGTSLDLPANSMKIYRDNTNIRVVNDSKRWGVSTFILEEDESVEIPVDDLIHGVISHKKFVKIDDEHMFGSDTERSILLVGFTHSKFVSEPYIGGDSTYHVLPVGGPGDSSYNLFRSFVKVLIDDDKYAICQRIYAKGNNPKFFALKGEFYGTQPRFVMTNLPYADDVIGNYLKCSKPRNLDVNLREDGFEEFCQSIDVSSDRCCTEVPLAPCMMLDKFSDEVVKETAKKLCGKDFEFKETEAMDFENVVKNQYWEELKKSWPEVED